MPKNGSAYEINRQFSFTMQCLGHGSTGERKFCGLINLSPPVIQSTYDEIQKNIYIAWRSKAITEVLMRNAVEEEQLRTSLKEGKVNVMELVVSGDGIWQKREFSSLFGSHYHIGVHSKKIDVNVK